MCKKAVEEDTNLLKYVLDHLKTQEMCIKDRGCPWLIGYIPDHFKTQDICIKAVEVCQRQLKYIPDWFVTQQQIKLWHDHDYYCNNKDKFFWWYEDHKKRKAQKASIKEELMSIAWHPSRY